MSGGDVIVIGNVLVLLLPLLLVLIVLQMREPQLHHFTKCVIQIPNGYQIAITI